MELWQKRESPTVQVEAVRLNEDNVEVIAAAFDAANLVEEIDPEHPEETQYGLNIRTPMGMSRATLGMYVYKFGKHLFVAHNRPFEEAYIPVNRDSPPPESAGEARKARGFSDPFGGRM